MKITYNPLWKTLIDKGIKKGELCRLADIAPATTTKMGRNNYVSTETIEKICNALNCGVADVMELAEE